MSIDAKASRSWRFSPTPVEWLCLLVGLILTWRYRWLMDDAFVYFRYIDNCVLHGNGLVYNVGEYVEGYSSPAWLMTLLGLRALHVDYWFAVQALGYIAALSFWWGLCRLDREMTSGRALLNLPLMYLAANYAVATYFTSGLETPLVQLCALAFALYVLEPGSRWRQIAVGLAPLVRHEFALPLLIVASWGWWRRRSFPKWMLLSAIAAVGTWEVFRIYYYANLFPNTYYLKSTVLEGTALVECGVTYLRETLSTYHVYVLAAFAIAAILLVKRAAEESSSLRLEERAVFLVAAGSVAAYVVSIGGDPRHYRYLAFSFCLATCASGGLATAVLRHCKMTSLRVSLPLGVLLLGLFSSFYPPQLSRHPFTHKEVHKRAGHINDASLHRHKAELQYRSWLTRSGDVASARSEQAHEGYLPEETATDWWCYQAFVHIDRRLVHSLGLTEPFLAMTPMETDRPAHKWGLYPLAQDLVRMYRSGIEPERGAFRQYVASGQAPQWIRDNVERLEAVGLRAWNRHDMIENIGLAFSRPEPIQAPQDMEIRPWDDRRTMQQFVLPTPN